MTNLGIETMVVNRMQSNEVEIKIVLIVKAEPLDKEEVSSYGADAFFRIADIWGEPSRIMDLGLIVIYGIEFVAIMAAFSKDQKRRPEGNNFFQD